MKYKSPYANVKAAEMICLATNENPHALPGEVIADIIQGLQKLNRYPKVDNSVLREKIAERFCVGKENVMIGSGSDELITLITIKFVNSNENTIMADPSFFRYKQATDMLGGNCSMVPCDKNYTHDLKAMTEQITNRTKIVFICNPNNPTGTIVTCDEIDEFMASVSKDLIVVVDEAYFDFVYPRDTRSAITLINKYKNLIVLRTFSKYFALAGIRVGYAIADASVISEINSIRSPYSVNSLAQIAAESVLDHSEYFDNVFYDEIHEEKEYLYRELKNLNIPFVESQANFIFAEFGPECEKWCELLAAKGIIIRPCAMFSYPQHVRITIGSHQENDLLINELKNIKG